MADLTPDIQARLQALRDSYTAQLPDKIGEIRVLWEKLRVKQDPEDLKTLHRLVHSLTGSGATFGYIELSDAARVLESCLKEAQEQDMTPDAQCCGRIDSFLATVEAVALAEHAQTQDATLSAPRPITEPDASWLLYLVEDDVLQAQELALQIQNFGYVVRVFAEPEAMLHALRVETPAVVIMDIMFPGGDMAGTETIAALKRDCQAPPPVLFVSSRDDFHARLEAVRACSDGYFTKPVDVESLIDKLDHLAAHRTVEGYRILIVDDDQALADHYALTLRQGGMEVVVVNNPLNVMESLVDLKPDLILMDLYMPDCDGLELAGVLRQQSGFDSVPIVFLSTEIDEDLRMKAQHLGADDFLTKPISPERLLASISSRAQRARVLRSYMMHDSLTGLYNHSTTKDYLELEFTRIRRKGGQLAYGMLDIDHFKAVNDTYGHAVGDRVLKSLARLLKQRLRKSDIIGRVGGEEFAVIFTDTSAVTAQMVMDDIRVGFAQVLHRGENREFSVTFSCGIATLENCNDSATLYKEADRALYQAKHEGRNRVVLA